MFGSDAPFSVEGGAIPPREPTKRFVPAVWPKPGVAFRAVILGKVFRFVPTHWHAGRTKPCYAPDDCQGCAERLPARGQYHLAVWSREAGGDAVLVLSPPMAGALMAAAADAGQLRGLDVSLLRTGRARSSSWRCDVVEIVPADKPLRADFPLDSHLCRYFNVAYLPSFESSKAS